MDNKLLNKTIQISAKEEKLQNGKPVVKIKDEKGLTYTIYKFKKDDSVSIAWEQMEKLSVGENVFIGYVEDQGEYEGKAVTYRTIRTLSTDIAQGMANHSAQTETPRNEANTASQSSSDDKFWDKKAYKQCLWGYWLEKSAPSYGNDGNLTTQMKDMVWETFKAIEADADKRFSVEPVGEDLNVEDIPF